MRNRRSVLPVAKLALACASAALTLGAVELGLRLLRPENAQVYSVAPTRNQYDFYRFDPVLGWANTPGASGTFRRAEFQFPVRINQLGMRQGPVSRQPPPGVRRVAFLGDSFVWGIGVADEERFTDLAGKAGGFEALNFGVSGYAPVQYFLMIDQVLALAPAVVVVAFCLGNDFSDNVLYERYGYYKPYASIDAAGRLAIQGYPLRNVRTFKHDTRLGVSDWLAWSRLARLASAASRDLVAKSGQAGLVGFDESLMRGPTRTPEAQALVTQAERVNQALFAELARRTSARGVELVVVASPSKLEYSGCAPEVAQCRRRGVVDALAASLAPSHIPLVDTVSKLGLEDFWVNDGHWNPQGHEKMAAAVLGALLGGGATTH